MRVRFSFDPKNIKRKLQNRARGLQATLPEQLQRAARLAAISLAYSTQPYGIDEGARKKGEGATASDVRRCYATPADVFSAFPDKRNANNFWAAISKGNWSRAQKIMQAHCPRFHNKQIRPFDGGAAHRANRNKRGRVSKKQDPIFVVQTTRDLLAYIKHEVDQVGFGKAGWTNCAKPLGGTRGLGSTKEGSAQWVTRHRAPALVIEDRNDRNPSITLINNVDYASSILDPAEKAEAVGIALERLSKAIFNEQLRIARANPLG